jgi:DNA-binding IclR family transcriptional regulator
VIRAVGRALAVFDAFDSQHLSLSLQDIAERIKMPKTTAFRLVATLERAGFLIRMDNQRYSLSLKLARLGGLVRSSLSILEIARPVMLQVNEQAGETVALNALVGHERMVLDAVDTPSPLMSMLRPGERMPLLLGASGRIMMAYMQPETLEEVLKDNVRAPDFDRAAFDRELARFRRQGYGITRGQRVPGLTAIAVPIFDIRDEVRYSLALTGPSVRIDPRDAELVDIMVGAGRDISSRLGASPENGLDLKLLSAEEGDADLGEKAKKARKAAGTTAAAVKPAARKRAAAAA